MIPVFLTTCSKSKVGVGSSYRDWHTGVTVPNKILKARNSLYEVLRQRELRSLREAVRGLDFVKDSSMGGAYLPAHVRYARGQFMTSLERELQETLNLWFGANRLFFLSGLYGIVSALEPIQNYDVELAGRAAVHWNENRNALTDYLLGLLETGSVLLDCCGDARYSDLVDWKKIEESGFPVLHATDRQREGAQVRAEAGFLAANINEERLKRMRDGEKFPGINADIKFISHKDFRQLPTDTSGHLPLVGVVETGEDEFCDVIKEAARQRWDEHFRFEKILAFEKLKRSFKDGVSQCICIIPKKATRT